MMRLGFRLAIFAAAVACAGAGCKTNSISENTNNASDVIGAAGGVLKGPNGSELLVPAGALTADTTFSLSIAQPGSGSYPESPPSGYQFVGDVFEYQPHGTQFLTPATVVVPYTTTPTTPVLFQAEEGSTTWNTVTISGMQTNAVEGAVSTLSYFVVAEMGSSSPDAGTLSMCSGRGPVAGAPTAAAVSGMTGTIPEEQAGSTTYPALDLSTVMDGYATQSMGSGSTMCTSGTQTNYQLTINFTNYAQACGYFENGDDKIGGTVGTIVVLSYSPIAEQAYDVNNVTAFTNGVPSGTSPGACGSENAGAPMGCPSGGTALTITTLDDSHVAGNFNFTPTGGSSPIMGTFDVPFCTAATDLSPQVCCVQ